MRGIPSRHAKLRAAAARLNPVFDIAGKRHVMVTQFAAAVHVRELGDRVASLSGAHETVTAALDLLITGV